MSRILDTSRDQLIETVAPVVFLGWLGLVWAFVAGAIAVILDLDQSWFDQRQVSTLTFLLRVVIFFPIWGAVQLEHTIGALGWDLSRSSLWILLIALAGALPPMVVGSLGVMWRRRHA